MSIYIFSLLVGYEVSGVDHAIGTLHTFIKKLKTPVKYVFTEVPSNNALNCYTNLGIGYEDMICAQFSMAGNAFIGAASIQSFEHQSDGIITARESVTDRPIYTDYFSQVNKDGVSTTQLSKRTFYKPDGSVAYEIIYDQNNSEQYIFPNGEICSKGEFSLKFMQSLCFSEDDLIIIHRPGHMDYMESLFLSKGKARTIVFLHSGHEFFPGEDPYFGGLNPAYYYFFQHADEIDAILVSTQEQKKDVLSTLKKYHFPKTNVKVLPIFGITKRAKVSERRPFSVLTVSRLDQRKHIDLLVRACIKAHELIPELTLDIYGTGLSNYIAMVNKHIDDANASSYITLKGYCDVSNVYDNYEVYITTSTWETFGITLLEAVSAGNAMIGFKARYGNTLFIKPDENGYLVDADFSRLDKEKYQEELISDFAQKLQLLFTDFDRLKSFHETSYSLSENYLVEGIEKMWIDYLSEFIS